VSTTLGDPLLALLTLLLYHSRGNLSTPFCDFFRSVLPSPPFHSVGGAGSHLYTAQQDSARCRFFKGSYATLVGLAAFRGFCPPDTVMIPHFVRSVKGFLKLFFEVSIRQVVALFTSPLR
jgi:hypothetical protein